ncbi:MAG: class II aldolase/adducin family protein [Thermodesulfobacteriota bacterium]|nr:class II aldolase/adducin family protein [Thermodesulfobacteriota bacterium]
MTGEINKYLDKLISYYMIDRDSASLFCLDDEIYTNKEDIPPEVCYLFDNLNINSLSIVRPDPVVWAIIDELAAVYPQVISPRDSESLTFIHDIPVIDVMDKDLIVRALGRRKGCIVKDTGIITTGTVSLEQAFISFSSICFATFVKYFSDFINGLYGYGGIPHPRPDRIEAFLNISPLITPPAGDNPLPKDVPLDEEEIITSMGEAGRSIVGNRLVDSFFGNISYIKGGNIYISQTGASLDELSGPPRRIDCVLLDGSSTNDLTSSSELGAHIKIYEYTSDTAILHGHPKFSVIMSMYGPALGFGDTRLVGDIPVVYGEVGAGKHGLIHTLPPAMEESHAAIVYGHGVFCSGQGAFHDVFSRLQSIEIMCYNMYKELVDACLKVNSE